VRLVALAVVLLSVVVVVYQQIIAGVIYEQRQRHLAADFTTPRPTVATGQALAVLQIPAIDVDLVVIEGDGQNELRGAPGHRSGTALPGAAGTSVISGHHHAYGGPFERLSDLAKGDQIAVQTKASPAFEYRVTAVYGAATPPPVSVFEAEPGAARLLLVTGGGGAFADDHVVVVAEGVPVLAGEAPAITDGALDPTEPGVPFGSEAIVWNFGMVGAAVIVQIMRKRGGLGLTIAVVAPVVLVAALAFAMTFDAAMATLR